MTIYTLRRNPTEFEVKEEHLKLLSRMYVYWDDSAYDGAPVVNIKRPYGNSDVMSDIYEIVVPGADHKPDEFWDDFYESETPEMVKLHEKLMQLHREMEQVVQITLNLAGRGELITVGTYYRPQQYNINKWEKK